jgi:hypothetical protein
MRRIPSDSVGATTRDTCNASGKLALDNFDPGTSSAAAMQGEWAT